MLQMKKFIITHCALRRYFAVDFVFFVNSVLPFLLKFISTHYHIQKQREKIEENPTEKMSCNRYNKITYAEFFPRIFTISFAEKCSNCRISTAKSKYTFDPYKCS